MIFHDTTTRVGASFAQRPASDRQLHLSFITVEQRMLLLANHGSEPAFSRVVREASRLAAEWLHHLIRPN